LQQDDRGASIRAPSQDAGKRRVFLYASQLGPAPRPWRFCETGLADHRDQRTQRFLDAFARNVLKSAAGSFFAARSGGLLLSSTHPPSPHRAVNATISILSGLALIGLKLGPHGFVSLAGGSKSHPLDQQHAAALDWPEIGRRGRAFMRALDQAGNIGQHEFAARRHSHTATAAWVVKG